MLLPSSPPRPDRPWDPPKWRRHRPLKHWYPTKTLHDDVTTQKTSTCKICPTLCSFYEFHGRNTFRCGKQTKDSLLIKKAAGYRLGVRERPWGFSAGHDSFIYLQAFVFCLLHTLQGLVPLSAYAFRLFITSRLSKRVDGGKQGGIIISDVGSWMN
jgi:hypothetical protein